MGGMDIMVMRIIQKVMRKINTEDLSSGMKDLN